MTDLVQFTNDVLASYWSLALPWKLLLGGMIVYYTVDTSLKALRLVFHSIGRPLLNIFKPKPTYEKGKIYVHMFPRKAAPGLPNLSPYAVKLETWLRLRHVQYEVVETLSFSKKTGQIPFVIYNDEEITDSSLIMEYFDKERNLDEADTLTDEQLGASTAITAMVDELLSWTYFLHRYVYQFNTFYEGYVNIDAPLPIRLLFKRNQPIGVMKKAKSRGIGLKTEAEVNSLAFQTLGALSQYLGDKRYMMGDSITKVDCAVFAHLSQILCVDFPYPHTPYIRAYCQNLPPYVQRVKQQLWPDWDTLVTKLCT